ncbi:MAG: xanthine dehydrogenase family protein subunit M [Verrucomicrobia bacterium]|nr:xanthine dehydrogenase family protein subunit M [Verrucomicrobiota bacterium]
MRPFRFTSATSLDQLGAVADDLRACFIAGGTTVVDLMKLEVMKPAHLIAIDRLPLRGIRVDGDGLRIGALETMSAVAAHPAVAGGYVVISQALLQSASAQLRNMATIGGNLLQRTRCSYFRDVNSPCNKRVPGSGCPAINGENRMLAILGTSPNCIATNPSDLAVALVALNAEVQLKNRTRSRTVPLREFYLEPGDRPDLENVLEPGELITEVRVPKPAAGAKTLYVKVRDRASYEFALSSAAVVLALDGNRVQSADIAVGGVGTKPWLLPQVGAALVGKTLDRANLEAAVALAADGAKRYSDNGFKVELMQRSVVRACSQLGGLA